MKRIIEMRLPVFFALLLLPALACGPFGGSPVELPEVTIPVGAAATAAAGAQQAGDLAATAVAVAGEQGGPAIETAVAIAEEEGGQALATLQATDVDVDVDVPVENDPIREKIANAQPDENGNVTVTVTDDEINQAIEMREQAAQEGGQTSTLQDVEVTFTADNVVIAGDLSQPVVAPLVATFTPVVGDGQMQFELVSATLNDVPIPVELISSVEGQLNTALVNALTNLPDEYSLNDVILGEGTMTVIATRNQ